MTQDPKWTDLDDAPEWTEELFERAEISDGDQVVRPATGTLTRHWNYRLIRFDDAEDDLLLLCEVHYENDVPKRYGNSETVSGETVEECKRVLEKMCGALSKPVLEAW